MPFLLRIGAWPGRHPIGFALKAGVAPDIGITGFDLDFSIYQAAELQFRTRAGGLFRLSAALERGLRTVHDFHVRTLVITLGVAPSVRRQ
jgi:hypothetical protein